MILWWILGGIGYSIGLFWVAKKGWQYGYRRGLHVGAMMQPEFKPTCVRTGEAYKCAYPKDYQCCETLPGRLDTTT